MKFTLTALLGIMIIFYSQPSLAWYTYGKPNDNPIHESLALLSLDKVQQTPCFMDVPFYEKAKVLADGANDPDQNKNWLDHEATFRIRDTLCASVKTKDKREAVKRLAIGFHYLGDNGDATAGKYKNELVETAKKMLLTKDPFWNFKRTERWREIARGAEQEVQRRRNIEDLVNMLRHMAASQHKKLVEAYGRGDETKLKDEFMYTFAVIRASQNRLVDFYTAELANGASGECRAVEKPKIKCPANQVPHATEARCISCGPYYRKLRVLVDRADYQSAGFLVKEIENCKNYTLWKIKVDRLAEEFKSGSPCQVHAKKFNHFVKKKDLKYLKSELAELEALNCPQYEDGVRIYENMLKKECQEIYDWAVEEKLKGNRQHVEFAVEDAEELGCPQTAHIRRILASVSGGGTTDMGSSDPPPVPAYCDQYLREINAYLNNNYLEGARETLSYAQDCPWYQQYAEMLGQMGGFSLPKPPAAVTPDPSADDCSRLRQELYGALSGNNLQGLKTAQGILQRSSRCKWYQAAHRDVSALAKKLHGQDVAAQSCNAIGQQLNNAIKREDLAVAKNLLADAGRYHCSFYQKARTIVEKLEKKVNFKQQCRHNQESFNQALRAQNAGRAESILNQSTQCDFYGPGMTALDRLKRDLARIQVPAVVGKKIEDARRAIMDAGLHMRIQYVGVAPSERQAHTVSKQSPAANAVAARESTVTIYAYTRACHRCSGPVMSWSEESKKFIPGTGFNSDSFREVACSHNKLDYCIDECTGRKHCYDYKWR